MPVPRERGARRIRTRGKARRSSADSGKAAAELHAEPAPVSGINPLFDRMSSGEELGGRAAEDAGENKSTGGEGVAAGGPSKAQAARPSRSGHKRAGSNGGGQPGARSARSRAASPQSTLTTSTIQSTSSSRLRQGAGAVSSSGNSNTMAGAKKPHSSYSRSAPASRNGSINKGHSHSSSGGGGGGGGGGKKEEFIPAPLVPALLAPVPPPPAKRKSTDIETGEVGEVLEDAPDKTLMEMLQTFLKKQDPYTRILMVVVLLLLAGGALGAYVLILWYAIDKKNPRYIGLVSVISLILFWVLWKYCFSGDQRQQDQSQIAQDIATLYAAMPDHTAVRGVSEKGRAQFTDFKYEKAEMMFTAVTDDGVSLGSERGSELMMDGADPSCPLCNKAYVEGAELCLLPCLHVFHKTCINKWCNRHIVCPLCKRHLEAAEPLHTLTAAYNHDHGNGVRSEPGGNAGGGIHRGYSNNTRGMLGTAAPGPASAHGSERGLGGTRSEDGMWNDRVLNAAQLQMGGKHNRVTSFSSETRRANSARGRAGERPARGGPPHSSSAGASVGGPQRSQSAGGAGAGGRQQQQQQQQQQQHHRLQRKRSSSFTTASEQRGRWGSGRVAQGTAPHRGSTGGLSRSDFSTSPRSRSDLGVGSREGDHLRANSDAMLSRYAANVRRNSGGGGPKPWGPGGGSSADESKGGEGKRNTTVVTVSTRKGSQKGVRSKGSGPAAVITVRKVAQKSNGAIGGTSNASNTSSVGAGAGAGTTANGRRPRNRRDSRGSGGRDFAPSGGESESDFGGERVFTTNSSRHLGNEEDSPDEVTTKALTYGPRKPRASISKEKSGGKDATGHRRQSSTGSTSADEVAAGGGGGGGGSGKKHRRRPSLPGSRSGSGNQSVIASAAATAEAVSKLLGRSTQEDRSASFSSRASGGGGGGSTSSSAPKRPPPATDPHSDAGSDSDARAPVRRNSRAASSSSTRSNSGLRSSHPGQQPQLKATPTKTGPVTKGTPAPPMAAARVATWNSSSSGLVPALDAANTFSASETEAAAGPAGGTASAARGADATPDAAGGGGGGNGVDPSSSTEQKKGSGRGWSIRIPSSAGSAEFFGFGGLAAAAAAADGGESEKEGGGGGGDGGGEASTRSSLASRVFSRNSGSGGKIGASAARIFGSNNAAARIGVAPGVGAGGGMGGSGPDSPADEQVGAKILPSSSSVQELIQTYEKKERSSSDEKSPPLEQDWPLPAPPLTSDSKKRSSKNFGSSRRRGSGASSKNNELLATESELDDDEPVDRPKLSYKRKGSRYNSNSSSGSGNRRASGTSATLNAMHSRSGSNSHVGSAVVRRGERRGGGGAGEEEGGSNVAGGYNSIGGGGGDATTTDGEEEEDDEPYDRPKLSYGKGLRSSSSAGPAAYSR